MLWLDKLQADRQEFGHPDLQLGVSLYTAVEVVEDFAAVSTRTTNARCNCARPFDRLTV